MKKILFAALLLIHTLSSFSQHRITGTVIDGQTRQPLSGANVVMDQNNFSMPSGKDGSFSFTSVPAGSYLLVVSFVGYQSYRKEIQVNGNVSLNIELFLTDLTAEGVIISASRVPQDAPATLTRLGKIEIQARNTGQDLPFVIGQIPSAVVTSDAGTGFGYTGLRIRGTDMTRINVTINGIPFNDPESHEVYWVDIPDIASSIDNIEIQRGVGTSSNGASSFGASINIQTTKVTTRPFALYQAQAGSYNTFRNTLSFGTGLLHDKLSIEGRVTKISSDGYIDRASASLKSFFVSGSWVAKKYFIKTNIFSGKERTYQAWYGIPSDILDTNRTYNPAGMYIDYNGKTQFYDNQVDDYQQDHYQALGSISLSSSTTLNAAIHLTHGKGYYEQYEQSEFAPYQMTPVSQIPYPTDLITRKWLDNYFYGTNISATIKKERLDLTLGGAWTKYEGDHFGKVIWANQAFVQPTFDYQWYFNRGKKTELNIYGKLLYNLTKSLNLLADLQWRNIQYEMKGIEEDMNDITQKHPYSFVNPKIGVSYKIAANQQVKLNLGMTNREPSRTNFKDADLGKTPKPEKLFDTEFGYSLQTKRYSAEATLYLMDYQDQLVLTGQINSVGAPIMVNVPQSYRAGIELSGQAKLTTWLDWQANLTLSRNRIKNFTEYVDNWDTGSQLVNELGETHLSFSPEWVFNSILLVKPLRHFSVSISTKGVGKQYLDNTSGDHTLDPYLVNDLKIAWEQRFPMFESVELSMQFNNLLSSEYETNGWVYRYYYSGRYRTMDGYFPQAPLNYLVGLTIKI